MTALALGCSHTAGTALDIEDCYVSQLSRMLNRHIDNGGVPGGNHMHVQNQLVAALHNTIRPDFVIAQWPNPFRRTIWYNGTPRNETTKNASEAFNSLLKSGPENFYQPWIESIIVCNLLCKTAAVPIIHIMIEDVEQQYHNQLAQYKITLETDRKLPGKSWLMDSGAKDNLHHSAACHKQWAERLFKLIDEYTK